MSELTIFGISNLYRKCGVELTITAANEYGKSVYKAKVEGFDKNPVYVWYDHVPEKEVAERLRQILENIMHLQYVGSR